MNKKLLLFLCMLLFLTACTQDVKPTETISAAPSGAAEASTSASESDLRDTEETASIEESTETTALPSTAAEETTPGITETESSPVGSAERKEVIIDLALQETLSPPPEVKEVFRTKNETLFTPAVTPGDTLHLRELDTGSGILEPTCFAALNENEFIIADTIARYFKLFRDGKCVGNYFMPPGVVPYEIEIDGTYFYYTHYIWGYPENITVNRVDLQTEAEEVFVPANPREDICDGLLWMDGQLIFINGYTQLGESNYYLDVEQGIFVPTSKGYHRRWDDGFVDTETITWHFDEESMSLDTRIFPVYVDSQDNLYVDIEDLGLGTTTLCKYSSEGELIWRIDAGDPEEVRNAPRRIKYCRDGRIYFMIIWEEETVIYQVQEEIR